METAAIIGVVIFAAVVAVGYFRSRRKDRQETRPRVPSVPKPVWQGGEILSSGTGVLPSQWQGLPSCGDTCDPNGLSFGQCIVIRDFPERTWTVFMAECPVDLADERENRKC